MWPRLALICACLLAFATGSCTKWRIGKSSPSSSPTTNTAKEDPQAQVKTLKEDLAAVKSRNLILAARLEEQLAREKRLSEHLNKLRFLNTQQQMQIEALADAPAQRDASRGRAEQLTRQVAELKEHIEELQAVIAEAKASP